MSTSKPDGMDFTSTISEVDDTEVHVRGYPLGELIRERTFVESTWLTLRGELPSAAEAAVFDAVLSALMAYTAAAGPNILAGRIAVSVNPQPWLGIATALSCAGPHTISPEHTGEMIARALAEARTRPVAEVAAEVAAEHFAAKRALPGIGHPEFKGIDPRAAAIEDVAASHGMIGAAAEMHQAIIDAYNALRAPKRALPLNVDGAMARALTELGFRPIQMHAISLISFLPGIAAHMIEEIEDGKRFRMLAPERETYTGPPRRSLPPREA